MTNHNHKRLDGQVLLKLPKSTIVLSFRITKSCSNTAALGERILVAAQPADRRAGLRLKPQLPPLQDDHFVIVTFFATPNVV